MITYPNCIESTEGFEINHQPPIVLRWNEKLRSGHRTWFLASLEPSGQYWGYVHIRTEETRENRSFVGQLDELKYRNVISLISELPSQNDPNGEGPIDGLIGFGTRSQFETLMHYREGITHSQSFLSIISILLPEMKLAAELTGSDAV